MTIAWQTIMFYSCSFSLRTQSSEIIERNATEIFHMLESVRDWKWMPKIWGFLPSPIKCSIYFRTREKTDKGLLYKVHQDQCSPHSSCVIGWGEFRLVLVQWCYFYVIISNWTWRSTPIPMFSTYSICITRWAYAQAWFYRSTLLHVESSLADCKICLFVDADEQEFLRAVSVGKIYVRLLFRPADVSRSDYYFASVFLRPSDVSRSGLYLLTLSVFFLPWDELRPNSHSIDPAKVYQRFWPRLNLINSHRHCVHPSPDFCRVSKVRNSCSILDTSRLWRFLIWKRSNISEI